MVAKAVATKMGISIHAPREGSDGVLHRMLPSSSEFQSTLPVRGATLYHFIASRIFAYFNPRSP